MKPQECNDRDPLDRSPKVARFRFHMRALEPILLPAYAGSAWRGILGHGLRRVTCVTREPRCDGCLLVHNCVYSTFFESPACTPPGSPGRYTHLPHPFVLEPDIDAPRAVREGDQLRLGIALIGPAREQVPYLIHALDKAGERGLGRQGGRFVLDRVESERRLGEGRWEPVYAKETGEFRRSDTAAPLIPPPPPALRLTLTTPLRIKRHGRFVGPREFAATDLLRHLLARLANLSEFYGGDPAAFDWQRLRHHADGVQDRDLRLYWREWTRYSSRQDTRMQMGGLLGDLTLAGPGIPAFWCALWLGQWVRVGKGTSFGLGHYRLEPL